jgi:SAM-dependent methyltransferase
MMRAYPLEIDTTPDGQPSSFSHPIEPQRHEQTFLPLSGTAADMRTAMPFIKTFQYEGEFINQRHARLLEKILDNGMIDIGIDGWLLPADALKLYEMAFFCPGDILELGAYRGLSATVMNRAIHDHGREAKIISIDLDMISIEASRNQLALAPEGNRALFFCDDGASAIRNLAAIKRKFGFAFVDHSHVYEHVYEASRSLHRVIELGGFALFHDFNDPRNSMESQIDYGVYQGALDGLRADRWEFWGIYGCTGLFRRIGPC